MFNKNIRFFGTFGVNHVSPCVASVYSVSDGCFRLKCLILIRINAVHGKWGGGGGGATYSSPIIR